MRFGMPGFSARSLTVLSLAGAVACSNGATTTGGAASAGSAPRTYPAAGDLPEPTRFVTRHETTIGNQDISFTATAGETYLNNDNTRGPRGGVGTRFCVRFFSRR